MMHNVSMGLWLAGLCMCKQYMIFSSRQAKVDFTEVVNYKIMKVNTFGHCVWRTIKDSMNHFNRTTCLFISAYPTNNNSFFRDLGI